MDLIASRCTEPESGGRTIDAILTNTVLPAISGAFLQRMPGGGMVAKVDVGAAVRWNAAPGPTSCMRSL